jgi:amino acid permease
MNCSELFGYLTAPQWTVVCATLLCIPYIIFRTLKEVGLASFSGALASVFIVVIVVIVSFWDYPEYVNKVTHEMFVFRSFGSVMGTFSFSFGGNYVYPEVLSD